MQFLLLRNMNDDDLGHAGASGTLRSRQHCVDPITISFAGLHIMINRCGNVCAALTNGVSKIGRIGAETPLDNKRNFSFRVVGPTHFYT